ncbi:vesicle associated protein [Striga asiatica]|uniref:Vesicle associated protein n=1 Tax=Striga asiatica TaxID=4170 RepID=A0A5A7QIF4_STRAF|nr:vesicle associated protein [Striga asiatica]
MPALFCPTPSAMSQLVFGFMLVTMQAQKEAPPDMQCKDKFLVQSVIAPQGTTSKEVIQEMFSREDGKVVEEIRLKVVYFPANSPSPVPEGDEEGTSAEDEIRKPVLSEVARSLKQSMGNSSSESWTAVVSKLNEEKASVTKHNQRLLRELISTELLGSLFLTNILYTLFRSESIKKQTRKGQGNGVSYVVLVFGLLLGILVGYLIGK